MRSMFCRTVIATAVILGAAAGSAAQTVDDLVERHLGALGGRAALEKLTSRTRIGAISVSTPAGDLNGPIETTNTVPNKSRVFIRFDLSAVGGETIVYDARFDGSSGYVINTSEENYDVRGNELHNLRNETFPTPLLDYRRHGASLFLSGKEKIGDREAYVLTLTPTTGPAITRYIDAESYLEIRTVTMTEDLRGEFELTTDFSDYRDVDGIKVPFLIRGSSSARNFIATLTNVTHNQPVDAAMFTKPAQYQGSGIR